MATVAASCPPPISDPDPDPCPDSPTSPISPHSPRTTRPGVYVTRRIPQKGVDILLRHCDVKQWDSEQAVPHGELLHSVVGAMAILCMPCDIIDAQVMTAAGPELRVVATISSSTDHIDLTYCKAHNIKVIPCPLQPARSIAELTVALLLLTIRDSMTDEERFSILDEPNNHDCVKDNDDCIQLPNFRPRLLRRRQSEEQLAFQWNNGKPANTNCSTWKNIVQKTFGIYGLTQTGTSIANLLQNVGVSQILLSDQNHLQSDSCVINNSAPDNYTVVPFTQLLSEADVICVCGSNEEKTEAVFGRDTFQHMKSSAILVTSQSEEQAIDYVALYEALRDGQIKAAGLNDCNQVPVPFKTPLLGLKNCIFLPQTQESVYDQRHKISVIMAKNLVEALKITA